MQLFLLLLGVLACSTSVILIKTCDTDPTILTASRLAVAVAVLAPLTLADWRRHAAEMTWGHVHASAGPGLVLAAHFITWMIGARMTEVVNSSLIVNTAPAVTPLLLWVIAREKVNRWELAATAVATLGLAILFAADFRASAASFRGDLICLGSMLLFATYLSLAKRRRHPTVWLYLTPLYASASLATVAAAPVLVRDWSFNWREDGPHVLALALAPTVVGHSLLNNAMRHLRGQVVMVVNLLQFVFAGLLGYVVLAEQPRPTFYPAGLLVVAAVVMIAARRGRGPAESRRQRPGVGNQPPNPRGGSAPQGGTVESRGPDPA